MFGEFFLGLIKQQWQGILRQALTGIGVTLIARGTFSSEQWANISPYIEGAVGALVALGSVVWTAVSNKPSTIIATANDLKARGHTVNGGRPK